jgi:hypothetical protein
MPQPRIIQGISATLAAVAFAITCASSALAAVTQLPAVQLSVNGQPVQLDAELQFIEDSGLWVSEFAGAGTGWAITKGDAVFAADPFVDYAFGVKNFTTVPLTFTFTFSTPFVDGPYNVLESSHSSNATDGRPFANGKVDITLGGFSFVHNPQIDGSVVPGSEISTGCSLTGAPGFSKICQGDSFLSVPVVTGTTGTLAVTLSFIVSARDAYATSGSVNLTSVPEPGTDLAMLAGILVLFGVIARRRMR